MCSRCSSIAPLGTRGKQTKTCLGCFWSVLRVARTSCTLKKGHFCFQWLSNDFKHSQHLFSTFKLDSSHLWPPPTPGQGCSQSPGQSHPQLKPPVTPSSSLMLPRTITISNSSVQNDSRGLSWEMLPVPGVPAVPLLAAASPN